MNTHLVDPRWLDKTKKLGVLNRLTPILMNLSIQHGISTPIISSIFQLNEGSVHNHLSRHAASKLRLREELILLSITTCEPLQSQEAPSTLQVDSPSNREATSTPLSQSNKLSRYAGVIPLRLQAIRPRLIAEQYKLSESMLRTYLHETGIEEELRIRQIERTTQALIDAVEQGILPSGLLS